MEGIVASGGRVGKDVDESGREAPARGAFGFLEDAVAEALSSAEAAGALSSCGDFMEYESGVRRALREGRRRARRRCWRGWTRSVRRRSAAAAGSGWFAVRGR